jgi:PKD repeat protein
LLYDLSELQYSNDGTEYFIEFPFALQGEATDINAVDFWMNFDLNKLAFESATISVANAEVFAHFNEVSQVLRVTASGDDINSFFITGEEVMKLRFTLVDPCEVITSIDFAPMEVLFNGVMSNALLNEAPDVTSAIIEVEAQSVYCANDEIAFSLEGEYYGQEYTTYEWSFGNGQESILPIGLVEYASGGDFVVNLTALTAAGCVSFLSTPISIENAPVVSFTATVAGDLSAEFQNNSTIATGTIVSYEWEFGDGNGSTEENPDHAYAAMGLFDVTLTATSDLGCTSSVTQTVDVVNSIFDIENSGIRIFPNPTNGIITIQAQDNFKCRVLDAAGRVVFDNIIITNGLKSLVDLSVLAPGNYHLILTNSMKNYSTQIVVIP